MIGASCVAGAYASAWLPGGAPAWGSWLMVIGLATMLPGTMLLGALRSNGPRRLLIGTAIGLGILLILGFGAALLLPVEASDAPLLLGLPLRAAIVIVGIGLLPILVLPLVYAHDFADHDLDAARVRALMEECARLRDHSPSSSETMP